MLSRRLGLFVLGVLVASGFAGSPAAAAPADGVTVGQPTTDCSDPVNAFGRALARAGKGLLVDASGELCGFRHLLDGRTGRELRQFRSPLNQEGNGFGIAVGMLGSKTALIGAPNEDAAYAFDIGNGALRATFAAPGACCRGFGLSIAGVGARVVVGAVYLFDARSGALRGRFFFGDDYQAGSGASVAFLRRGIAVGAPYLDRGQVRLQLHLPR